MKFIRNHWRKMLISTVLLVLPAAAGLVLWAGSQIASPSRLPLMDYHREFLSNPAAHGFPNLPQDRHIRVGPREILEILRQAPA